MSRRAHGQLRQSQVITTYGPGALIDLPRHSAIVAGLDTWPNTGDLEEIQEARLTAKLQAMTGIPAPRLYAPPPQPDEPWAKPKGIGAWRFPEWFLVQETDSSERSRRLVHRKGLENGRFEGLPVVPTRFVRACPRGHVDDLDWIGFTHAGARGCPRQLWLDELGTTGDLAELVVRCECGSRRRLYEATELAANPLGTCQGRRPWLGNNTNEDCNQPSRLLIRTASNAYFPQILSVLSLPDRATAVEAAVCDLWDDLQIVDDPDVLAVHQEEAERRGGARPVRRRRGDRGDPLAQERDGRRAAGEGRRARRDPRCPRRVRRRRPPRPGLPRPPAARPRLAATRAQRRDRLSRPASPAPRGASADRVHPPRTRHAGHPRRVRHRRGTRPDRP